MTRLWTLLTLLFSVNLVSSYPPSFTEVTIFDPPDSYNIPRTLYARTVELPNGDLLATWENYSPQPPLVYFPIYRSQDGGQTWSKYSEVHDQVNGYGLRYQPFLYLLPEQIGGFDAGTLLLAGNSIPADLSSTEIDLYASPDLGKNWKFVSRVAKGGEAIPNNGLTPVWEPFLMAYQGKLICYYSDQRQNETHGQLLAHQVSVDLLNWGPVVNDVAQPTYTDRPGMTTVTLLPNGNYMMTYEYGSFFNTSRYSFPVFYRISADPEAFNDAEDHRLVVSDGAQPESSPYLTWTPYPGNHGTIIVSCGTSSSIFVNQALGKGEWTEIQTPESTSYTRSLRLFQEDRRYLLITGGGVLNGNNNSVTTTSINLKQYLH